MTCGPSRRMQRVQQPMIPVVGEWIAQHPGTISLGQGIVHYDPPREVHAAVVDALGARSRLDRYGLVRGNQDFLSAIAAKLLRDNAIHQSHRRSVVVTAGSNMGFVNAILAICDVGDEVILLSPYYFNHEMAIDMAGCRPVVVDTDEEYQIRPAALEAALTDRTRAIVTVSPNNPTGAVYPAASLVAVNQLCRARGIFHINDEAYEYFTYDGHKHFSPASLEGSEDHTISLYSLSKAYGMAGWRVGYMIVPSHLETAVKKVQDTNLVCPPMASQVAGTAALRLGRSWCDQQTSRFAEVRNLVLAALNELGDRCRSPRPDGAFYVLVQLDTNLPDLQIVETLIRQFGVAVMPGTTFGVAAGCRLRIAYGALERETVAEGMGRLVQGLREIV